MSSIYDDFNRALDARCNELTVRLNSRLDELAEESKARLKAELKGALDATFEPIVFWLGLFSEACFVVGAHLAASIGDVPKTVFMSVFALPVPFLYFWTFGRRR